MSIQGVLIFEGVEWLVTSVYGPNDCSLFLDFLGEIDGGRNQWPGPWCLRGDFIAVRVLGETSGGGSRIGEMRLFSYFIDSQGLRHNVNTISRLQIGEEVVEDKAILQAHVMTYFKDIYVDSGLRRPMPDGLIFKQLDEFPRHWLERPILEEEVRSIIWSFEGDKAFGPDGFMMAFYKLCWGMF